MLTCVFHLLSGQYIISEVDPRDRSRLYNPMELHAIPPSDGKGTSFLMTPFGTFYGLVPRQAVLMMPHANYYCSATIPQEDPLAVAYVKSIANFSNPSN